ncbi:MAG: hypothetical protein KGJ37_01160 [Verrucomicrobiota bacterium]|nr:hypothetical protein [Verrucomicrobiota bacterium]
MSPAKLIFIVLLTFWLAGCSTPSSRIGRHQAEFDAWPPEVQQKVRAGRAGLGFTAEQVRLALGDPDRKYTRTTAQGTSEVWAYENHGPTFGFGLGLGTASGSSAYGAGVGVTTGDDRYDDKLRVVFAEGKVVALEQNAKK